MLNPIQKVIGFCLQPSRVRRGGGPKGREGMKKGSLILLRSNGQVKVTFFVDPESYLRSLYLLFTLPTFLPCPHSFPRKVGKT